MLLLESINNTKINRLDAHKWCTILCKAWILSSYNKNNWVCVNKHINKLYFWWSDRIKIIITIHNNINWIDLFFQNNKKSLKWFRIHSEFILLWSKLYEKSQSCQTMFSYVIFWVFTFIKMFIFYIVSLFYLIQDLSENLICKKINWIVYMIEGKGHVSAILFIVSFYFISWQPYMHQNHR